MIRHPIIVDELQRKEKLSVGVLNHGQICYISSVLQCLSIFEEINSELLPIFLKINDYWDWMKYDQDYGEWKERDEKLEENPLPLPPIPTMLTTHKLSIDNSEDEMEYNELVKANCFSSYRPLYNRSDQLKTLSLAHFINRMWRSCYDSSNLLDRRQHIILLVKILLKDSNFYHNSQEDAQEFLRYLIDEIDQECSIVQSSFHLCLLEIHKQLKLFIDYIPQPLYTRQINRFIENESKDEVDNLWSLFVNSEQFGNYENSLKDFAYNSNDRYRIFIQFEMILREMEIKINSRYYSVNENEKNRLIDIFSEKTINGDHVDGNYSFIYLRKFINLLHHIDGETDDEQVLTRSKFRELFEGEFQSNILCKKCGFTSTKSETFLDLSLSIPNSEEMRHCKVKSNDEWEEDDDDEEVERCRDLEQKVNWSLENYLNPFYIQLFSFIQCHLISLFNYLLPFIYSFFRLFTQISMAENRHSKDIVNIYHCLQKFCDKECLINENQYYCPHCKCLQDADRCIKLEKLPQILVLHLKRSEAGFRPIPDTIPSSTHLQDHLLSEVDSSSSCLLPYTEKNNDTGIDIVMDKFDLSPFLVTPDRQPNLSTIYELKSVVCHKDCMKIGNGHYISYVRNNNNDWIEYNDHRIRTVLINATEIDVKNYFRFKRTFMLFYRKSTPPNLILCRSLLNKYLRDINFTYDHQTTAQISVRWLKRLLSGCEPGPIDNSDFICVHHQLDPSIQHLLSTLSIDIPLNYYKYLFMQFGGYSPLDSLELCKTCSEQNEMIRKNKTSMKNCLLSQSRPNIDVNDEWKLHYREFLCLKIFIRKDLYLQFIDYLKDNELVKKNDIRFILPQLRRSEVQDQIVYLTSHDKTINYNSMSGFQYLRLIELFDNGNWTSYQWRIAINLSFLNQSHNPSKFDEKFINYLRQLLNKL
ncbi:hypothetical protein SNEBB_000701 [Seison nebaliae]|nr:hypothetical protein SNEBB_000701 [Seison nebaliae]